MASSFPAVCIVLPCRACSRAAAWVTDFDLPFGAFAEPPALTLSDTPSSLGRWGILAQIATRDISAGRSTHFRGAGRISVAQAPPILTIECESGVGEGWESAMTRDGSGALRSHRPALGENLG